VQVQLCVASSFFPCLVPLVVHGERIFRHRILPMGWNDAVWRV